MISYHLYQPFPVIDLGDIILREIIDADAKDYFDYMSRLEMEQYLTADNRPATIDAALEDVRYWGSLFSSERQQ